MGMVDPARYNCKQYSGDITVLTVTYGETELVDYMTRSLFRRLGYPLPVVVVNNKETHVPTHDKEFFTEIDNNGWRLTDPDGSLHEQLRKEPSDSHASAVSYGLANCVNTRWCLLCDNDVLFKPTIKYLLESPAVYPVVGEVGCDKIRANRVFPYMCIIDVNKMKEDGILYFHPDRGASKDPPRDTGTSFLEDIYSTGGWKVGYIDLGHFILHMKGATFHHGDWRGWLEANKEYQ